MRRNACLLASTLPDVRPRYGSSIEVSYVIMTLYHSLTGKYFIMGALVPHVSSLLTHGRILGPVGSELSTFYLCELYPYNSKQLSVTNQIVYPLEALAKGDVYLYDDRAIFEIEWGEVVRRIEKFMKQQRRAMRDREKPGPVVVGATVDVEEER